MPERTKTVTRMVEHAMGGPIVWNGLIGEPHPGQMRPVTASFVAREPIEISARVWDRTADEMEKIYELIMNSIDFNRIIISASGIHLTRSREDEGHLDTAGMYLCGECLCAALLSKER